MNRPIITAGARLLVSMASAAAAFLVWLALFLTLAKDREPPHEPILWVLPPLFTALGFAGGMALAERWTHAAPRPRLWIALFPLAGTTAGAAIVYPFGPMLIVFGMCVLGTVSMLLLEVLRYARNRHKEEPG